MLEESGKNPEDTKNAEDTEDPEDAENMEDPWMNITIYNKQRGSDHGVGP